MIKNFFTLRNLFSVFIPAFTIIFAWMNGGRFSLSYHFLLFKIIFISLFAIVYVSFRATQNTLMPIKRELWLIILMFSFFSFSLIWSQNFYAGIPRIIYLASLFVFTYLMLDLFEVILNHKVVLYTLIVVAAIFLVGSLSEALSAYMDWWSAFGFMAENPPYSYRIVSVLNSSNPLMAFINLLALPVFALLIFDFSKMRKTFLVFWLICYVIVTALASSRGGYVGALAGISAFIGLNIKKFGLKARYISLSKYQRVILLSAVILVFALVIFFGYQFLIKTSSHPSHGGTVGELNLNRTGIWLGYLRIWRESPWFGSGIGRYSFAYLDANRTSPPGFWPTYSHGLPFGLLAEFGVVGAVLFIALLVFAAVILIRHYMSIDPPKKFLASGVLAGIISLAIHSLVDDFLNWPTVFFCGLILVAWLITYDEKKLERHSQIAFTWFIPVILLFSSVSFWNLYPYQNLYNAKQDVDIGKIDTLASAEKVEQSLNDSPNSHLYLSQAAFFWVNNWIETGEVDALEKADQYFKDSLEVEPGISPMWLNKSVVSWNLGKPSKAIDEISIALELAPNEPVYHLNLGWFYEQLGDSEKCLEQYSHALLNSDNLGWYTHPFWTQSELRGEALSQWMLGKSDIPKTDTLNQFLDAYRDGDIEKQRMILARTIWEKKSNTRSLINFMQGLTMLSVGNSEKALNNLLASYTATYDPIRLYPFGWWNRLVYRRAGWEKPFIPGVLQLSYEFGQLENFEFIYSEVAAVLPKSDLCLLYNEYSKAYNGGLLIHDSIGVVSQDCNNY